MGTMDIIVVIFLSLVLVMSPWQLIKGRHTLQPSQKLTFILMTLSAGLILVNRLLYLTPIISPICE